LIDNESTLLNGPDVPGAIDYVEKLCANQDWGLAAEILVPKLEQLKGLPDAALRDFTSIPPGYRIARKGPIPERLPQFRDAAKDLATRLEEFRRWAAQEHSIV
jgi:hypothetical protein